MSRFNIRYSDQPGHQARRSRRSKALTPAEASAANAVIARAVADVSPWLGRGILSCRPGLRCGAWRYCAFCSVIRENSLIRKYRSRLAAVPKASLLTLTTRATPIVTPRTLPDLAESFRKLRGRVKFTRAVAGGVVNFQLARARNGWWLPHLHAILDQRDDVPRTWIKDTWTGLTGGRQIDIKAITPDTWPRVLRYGARKPDLPPRAKVIRVFRRVTHKFRFISPWGSITKLHGKPQPRRGRVTTVADQSRLDAESDAEFAAMPEPCICGGNCGGGCATP